MGDALRAFVSIVIAVLCASGTAAAQDVASFYAGQTIRMIIGYPTGGSNDIYARTVAQHIGKHIPGSPRVIAVNMPGAGSMLAANHLFTAAPRDGSVIASVSQGIPLQAKLGYPEVRYEAGEVQLDRPHGAVDQRHHGLAHEQGDDVRRRAAQRGHAERHRRRLDGDDLSQCDERAAQDPLQADHGLQGLRRRHAGDAARRGGGPLDHLGGGEGGASGLGAEGPGARAGPARHQPPQRIAGRADVGRAHAPIPTTAR